MRRTAVLLGLTLGGATALVAQAEPVRVADLIGMTLFGSDAHNGATEDIHVISPDGRQLAVVVQRGNLSRNTVDYSLLLFRTANLESTLRPDTLASLSATSNDPAISHVVWLSDNHSLAFLGRRPGESPQIYTVDVVTHSLTARTHSGVGVASFEMAPDRKSTRLNSSHLVISYAVFCLKKKNPHVIDRDHLVKLALESDLPFGDARRDLPTAQRLPDWLLGW